MAIRLITIFELKAYFWLQINDTGGKSFQVLIIELILVCVLLRLVGKDVKKSLINKLINW